VNSDHSNHQGALTLSGHPQGPAESHSPLCTDTGQLPATHQGTSRDGAHAVTRTGTAQSILSRFQAWTRGRGPGRQRARSRIHQGAQKKKFTKADSRAPEGPAETTACTAHSAKRAKPPGGESVRRRDMAAPKQQLPAVSYLNILSPKVYVAHLGQQKPTL
jgi:hypothetical protein